MTAFVSPVDQLFTRGEPGGRVGSANYRALGIGEEHIPDLIRMALDKELRWAPSESDAAWAPVHAWRALGELRAEAAIEPLLDLFQDIDEHSDDWVGEELPEVYGLIGPAAIPALAAYLADPSHGLWARVGSSSALGEIGQRHPASRAECVTALTRHLERFADNDPVLNGSILAELLDLRASEAAPVIERAFAGEAIDETIAGDWEDVQVELGLKDKRSTPRPRTPLDEMLERIVREATPPPPPPNPQVDAVIAQMRAEGKLKSPAEPKRDKRKKKQKRK